MSGASTFGVAWHEILDVDLRWHISEFVSTFRVVLISAVILRYDAAIESTETFLRSFRRCASCSHSRIYIPLKIAQLRLKMWQ